MNPIEKWHQIVKTKDISLYDELLDKDVVFYSPVVFTPQKGIDLTKAYLMAAGGVFADKNEPSKEELVNTLIPRHLNVQMWKYLLESYASEQAARMLSMENATSNAQDMIKDLTLQFNKARQAAITTEMLEIVGGAEALD